MTRFQHDSSRPLRFFSLNSWSSTIPRSRFLKKAKATCLKSRVRSGNGRSARLKKRSHSWEEDMKIVNIRLFCSSFFFLLAGGCFCWQDSWISWVQFVVLVVVVVADVVSSWQLSVDLTSWFWFVGPVFAGRLVDFCGI
ncbi:hypothetical protein IEQ34_014860 [Dendrobium chrysotoxum]|uniref:Transmembrane protein n=1 Tax=Dendrobium chrysotoxum TaxID=161865 RepID=A0AAV7GMR6_DENCH|nr:hypothetical protein IEQ34_014860 [Dendrobium chrysotoxum]